MNAHSIPEKSKHHGLHACNADKAPVAELERDSYTRSARLLSPQAAGSSKTCHHRVAKAKAHSTHHSHSARTGAPGDNDCRLVNELSVIGK